MRTNSQIIQFGYISLIRFVRRDSNHQIWLGHCRCGSIKEYRLKALKTGNTKSCGCFQKQAENNPAFIHGHGRRTVKSREYICWTNMKARCENPKVQKFKHYGGRGISVCPQWKESFATFLTDMGPCPSRYEIDRIDVDGNYEPNNCRWVPHSENVRNRWPYGKA